MNRTVLLALLAGCVAPVGVPASNAWDDKYPVLWLDPGDPQSNLATMPRMRVLLMQPTRTGLDAARSTVEAGVKLKTQAGAEVPISMSVQPLEDFVFEQYEITVTANAALAPGWHELEVSSAAVAMFEGLKLGYAPPDGRVVSRFNLGSDPIVSEEIGICSQPFGQPPRQVVNLLFSEPVGLPQAISLSTAVRLVDDATGQPVSCSGIVDTDGNLLDPAVPVSGWSLRCDSVPDAFSITISTDAVTSGGLPLGRYGSAARGYSASYDRQHGRQANNCFMATPVTQQ